MLWILIVIAASIIVYWYIALPHKYWTDRGVKQSKPRYLFGDSLGMVMRKQAAAEMIQIIYNIYPKSRYTGFYQFLLPTLLIRDPELIKQITVKDFDHFLNHRSFVPENSDPLWAGNLFALTDQKWRDMRTLLSPAFTSSKMKHMFSFIVHNGQQFVDHFLKKNEEITTLEMRDTFTRFTNDVIANTVFGVKCDSLKERNNEFYIMGKQTTDFSTFFKKLTIIGYLLFPKLCTLLKLPLLSTEVRDFFTRLVKTNIESREKHGIVRLDMIHLLLEARKNRLKNDESEPSKDTGFATAEESEVIKNHKISKFKITDQAITSQALIFFFAGFDTVSSLMCFMAHELAINPEIQLKLIQEVDDTRKVCDDKLTYEALLSMKYMDMVVSETLRKWPNNVMVDRVCTKPYTIQPKYPDEKPIYVERDTVLWLPIFGLHRDSNYYPDPDRFDPERFNDENKGKIHPYTYLPFGVGPRNCIGSRFALLETKTLFFNILSHFEIVPVGKTQIPIEISKTSFNLTADRGFWLGFKRRVVV